MTYDKMATLRKLICDVKMVFVLFFVLAANVAADTDNLEGKKVYFMIFIDWLISK